MRDRLAKLCNDAMISCEAKLCVDCEQNNIDYPKCMGVYFADYLLENGVIVAPMPMADWLRQELTEYIHKRCVDEL